MHTDQTNQEVFHSPVMDSLRLPDEEVFHSPDTLLSRLSLVEVQQAMTTNPPRFNLGQLVSVDIWIEGYLERLSGVVTGLNYSYFPSTNARAWEYSVVPDGDTIEEIFQEEQVHPAAEVTT